MKRYHLIKWDDYRAPGEYGLPEGVWEKKLRYYDWGRTVRVGGVYSELDPRYFYGRKRS